MSSTQREAPQFGIGKSILFSLILVAVFFALIEVGLRVYVYAFRSPAEVWDFSAGTFDLRPGAHPRPFAEDLLVNSRGFVGEEFEDPPPPGTVRIVAVGDSCTFGQGTPKGHYPALLEDLLNADSGDVSYQVVNAGIEGLNSELALRRLEHKVLPLEPDVVTIYIGWNDLMKFDPAGQTEAPRLAIVARVLDKLWTVKGLRKLLFYYVRPRMSPPETGPGSRTGQFADYRSAVFERHLVEMIEAARSVGAKVAIMTMPSVVSDDLTAEDVRRLNVQFPYFRSAYAVGDFVDLIAAYNRSIRRVAEAEDVVLIDLARKMDARPDRQQLFLDTMHANQRGREVIAEIVEDTLRRELLSDPSAG